VTNLVKRYAGRAAVDGLTFEIAKGEVFALLGPNGAGKTTTIEILEGYRNRDGGDARVLGCDPGTSASGLRSRVGLMLQQGGFYPMTTPREALRLYASFYDKPLDPEILLRQLGLEGAAETRFRRLSGGQKQRLSLAIALVGQPELLFLDEPTAGMDPQARNATWDVVRQLKTSGVTIVLTTHLIEEAARVADRVAIVDGGKLIALGTPSDLSGGGRPDVVRLTVDEDVDLAGIEHLASVIEVTSRGPGMVVVRTSSPLDLLVNLANWLRANEIVPRELRFGGDSLEDAFLRLTGKDLRE
jgi:ABC-2 type transport system ATP-binding protein